MARVPGPGDCASRRKVARVTGILESIYGTPAADGRENVLECLMGCILSQNTTDANCDRARRNLARKFPTWRDVARAPRKSVEKAISVAGLGPSRSRRIKDILALVKRTRGKYDLEFLRDFDDEEAFAYLSALKGVGKKTAAIVLLFALERDVFPVDTHVHVIARRLGVVAEDSPRDEVYERMKPLVPRGKAFSLHLNLVRFGKERCRKRNPMCAGCPLARECLRAGGFRE